MAVSDEGLLAGMAGGDPQSAANFVRRFQSRVFGLALTIVGIPATAEEVAQEAFLRAWRYAGAYDPRRGAVSTWLLTITRNAAIDVVRAGREYPYTPDELVTLLSGRTEPGPDADVDSDRIRIALRSLPREQAKAVVLATFYGMTSQEIGDREGVPRNTVKTRIRLGLARLRDQLEVSDD